jgi:heat shock protein HtpX
VTSTIATTATTCPTCGSGLVSERAAQPWCPACEWGLDTFEPKRRRPELSWRWVDRMTFRAAYRMNAGQFEALRGGPLTPPSLSVADAFVTTISLTMLLFVVGLAALGVYVAVFTSIFLPWFVGGLLILIAIALRPRFGSLDKRAYQVSRADAPELFRLIDEVAAAIGAKPPHVVLARPGMTAFADAYGLRRRRVLGLGMPLWMALSPQQRVALLGHELGHFVNGDVARKPLNVMAFTTLGTLSELTVPPRRGGLGAIFAQIVLGAAHQLLATAQTFVTALAMRSTQRAEYYADALAAWVGGTQAAIGCMDVLLLSEGMYTVVRSAAQRSDVIEDWVAAGQRAQSELAPRVPRLRQLTKRDEASLFSSHPPTGLRALMLESRPFLAPAVVLTESRSQGIDREMAKCYRYMVRNT